MNVCHHFRSKLAVLACCTGVLVPNAATGQDPVGDESGKWQFAATIYAYLPTIGGQMAFPVAAGGTSINVDADTLLENLKFVFMGSLDAHNGRWGMFTDVIYMNVGGSKSQTRDFSIGNIGLPAGTTADLNFDLKSTVWSLAGLYRVVSDPVWRVDVLAGARLLDVKPSLGWTIYGDLGPITPPGRSGSAEINESVWDAIIGLKGRYLFGDDRRWGIPFYLDVGTGQTQLTWQGAIGISYSYSWGDLIAMWRYLDYDFKSGKQIESLNLNGPLFGATFRW